MIRFDCLHVRHGQPFACLIPVRHWLVIMYLERGHISHCFVSSNISTDGADIKQQCVLPERHSFVSN